VVVVSVVGAAVVADETSGGWLVVSGVPLPPTTAVVDVDEPATTTPDLGDEEVVDPPPAETPRSSSLPHPAARARTRRGVASIRRRATTFIALDTPSTLPETVRNGSR